MALHSMASQSLALKRTHPYIGVYGINGGVMPKLELSDRFISTLKPAESAADYFDSKARGLNLRVTPTGVKAWYVMFTSPRDGKRARLSLGTYPATPLAKARTLAIEARAHVESGIDPRDLGKPAGAGPMTVSMLAESYLAKHAVNLRSYREIGRKMRVDILPVIGDMAIAELHRRDVHRVLDPIKERGSPASARKVFTELRAMLSWAVARGLLDHNPATAMQEDDPGKPRERFLDEEEIATLWPALSTFSKPVELALRLALITGQRIGEVCGMTEDEIDLAKAIWTIPAERSKNGEAHKVPLSDMALDLIAEARSGAINGRVINRSPDAVAHALGYAFHRGKRRSLPVSDFTAHDLRRTVCTHLAKMGVSPLIIGAVVNHKQVTKAGVTLGVYVQYDYAKEKREALDMWADRLAAIVSGGAAKLIHMHGHGVA
jgi:integrase